MIAVMALVCHVACSGGLERERREACRHYGTQRKLKSAEREAKRQNGQSVNSHKSRLTEVVLRLFVRHNLRPPSRGPLLHSLLFCARVRRRGIGGVFREVVGGRKGSRRREVVRGPVTHQDLTLAGPCCPEQTGEAHAPGDGVRCPAGRENDTH